MHSVSVDGQILNTLVHKGDTVLFTSALRKEKEITHNPILCYILGISLKAVQLLQHFEHIVSPLARAVAVIANKFEAHSFVADIIR